MKDVLKKFMGQKWWVRTLILVGIGLSIYGIYVGSMWSRGHSAHLNLEVVEPGKLIRTAQPTVEDLEDVRDEYGIGTLFSLRGREDDEVREWAEEEGIPVLVTRMKADDPPTAGQVGLFFDIMRGETIELERYSDVIEMEDTIPHDAKIIKFPFPVLMHCEGGADRTGVMTALYRMAFQDWNAGDAKMDMMGHWHITWAHPDQFDHIEDMEGVVHPHYGSRTTKRENASTAGER